MPVTDTFSSFIDIHVSTRPLPQNTQPPTTHHPLHGPLPPTAVCLLPHLSLSRRPMPRPVQYST